MAYTESYNIDPPSNSTLSHSVLGQDDLSAANLLLSSASAARPVDDGPKPFKPIFHQPYFGSTHNQVAWPLGYIPSSLYGPTLGQSQLATASGLAPLSSSSPRLDDKRRLRPNAIEPGGLYQFQPANIDAMLESPLGLASAFSGSPAFGDHDDDLPPLDFDHDVDATLFPLPNNVNATITPSLIINEESSMASTSASTVPTRNQLPESDKEGDEEGSRSQRGRKRTSNRSAPTGFKAHSLLPLDAPVQPRSYPTPSRTSRRASASSGATTELERKRLQNTISARRSRARKAEKLEMLEEENERLREECERLRSIIKQLGGRY